MESYLQHLRDWFVHKQELCLAFFRLPVEERRFPICFTGEIHYAYLGTNIGSEINKARPVLIFQSRDLRFLNTVIILPLTTTFIKNSVLIQKVDLQWGDIAPSYIAFNQIRCISKQRLTKCVGRVGKEKMIEVTFAFTKIFPLHE